MEDGQASIVLQNQLGERYAINVMSDYANASHREASSRLEVHAWILDFAYDETWEVPHAVIEGG